MVYINIANKEPSAPGLGQGVEEQQEANTSSFDMTAEIRRRVAAAVQELRDIGVSEAELIDAEQIESGGSGLSGIAGENSWMLKKEDDGNYTVIITGNVTNNTSDDIAAREGKHDGLTEEARAQLFWDTKLKNEIRIETPQNPECEFAIVVPVYNETLERILKQIQSLTKQRGIDSAKFEIIYVVNNDIPNESLRSKACLAANQRVIDMLRTTTEPNIFVIDKSSSGNEIPGCCVGKARNRGIAEASRRFHENKKNGILIQTDADTYFEDPDYLEKLRALMSDNPDCIGIAGGLIYEFHPDTNDQKKNAELRKKLEVFLLKKKWEALVQFLNNPEGTLFIDYFCGANMISRSYESAIIGGVIDTTSGEDPRFGEDLEAYASGRGQKVRGAKNELVVVTALRDSDRTTASFKRDFDEIDLQKPFLMPDPFAPETLPQFREKLKVIFPKGRIDEELMRKLMSRKNGTLIVSENAFREFLEHLKQSGFQENEAFFRNWITENFMNKFDFIGLLYDLQYPQIPLTETNYDRLVTKVLKEPNGSKIMNGLDMATVGGKIRIS